MTMREVGSMSFRSMRLGRKASARLGRLVVFMVLSLGAFAFVAPFVWVLSTSLKSTDQLYDLSVGWLPKPPIWSNYREALTFLPFATYFKNTMFVCALTVIGSLLSCSMVAYAFARLRFPGRNVLFVLVISTTMMPWAVRIIPTYLIFKYIGWVGTLTPLWFPAFLGTATYIFLLRQFFMGIPYDLTDAARIDGCGEVGIYWRVMLPLSGPALTVIAIFAFLNQWNDFIRPLIYLSDQSQYTMALGLQLFIGLDTTHWNLLMAAAVAMTVPVLFIFAFFQRYMIQGVTLTGIKG